MKNKFLFMNDEVLICLNDKGNSCASSLVTRISIEDLARVQEFTGKWYAYWDRKTKSYYVRGKLNGKTIHLHRWILNCPDGLVVDHIDHSTLNNTRNNLRIVTHSENMQNLRPFRSKSGIRGVHWHKMTGEWRVEIMANGKRMYFGLFSDIEKAKKVAHKAMTENMAGYVPKGACGLNER